MMISTAILVSAVLAIASAESNHLAIFRGSGCELQLSGNSAYFYYNITETACAKVPGGLDNGYYRYVNSSSNTCLKFGCTGQDCEDCELNYGCEDHGSGSGDADVMDFEATAPVVQPYTCVDVGQDPNQASFFFFKATDDNSSDAGVCLLTEPSRRTFKTSILLEFEANTCDDTVDNSVSTVMRALTIEDNKCYGPFSKGEYINVTTVEGVNGSSTINFDCSKNCESCQPISNRTVADSSKTCIETKFGPKFKVQDTKHFNWCHNQIEVVPTDAPETTVAPPSKKDNKGRAGVTAAVTTVVLALFLGVGAFIGIRWRRMRKNSYELFQDDPSF